MTECARYGCHEQATDSEIALIKDGEMYGIGLCVTHLEERIENIKEKRGDQYDEQ